MSFEYKPSTSREFPVKLVGCVNARGYDTEDNSEIIYGLGKRVIVYKSTTIVTATVTIESATDMALFAHWYFNEISRGVLSFTIEIPIFGITKPWEVMLINKLNESDFECSIRKTKLELEVLTDISKIIEQDASGSSSVTYGGETVTYGGEDVTCN